MRTVIHPGHIFHAFPVTYFGNQRIIVKRKNKVRNFFLKIRREPGFKFRIITFLGILKRIFNYLRCTAVFRQMRKRIQEVDVTVTVPVHEENFHMCSDSGYLYIPSFQKKVCSYPSDITSAPMAPLVLPAARALHFDRIYTDRT